MKIIKPVIYIHNSLKEWFDPSLEGTPYEAGVYEKRVSFKRNSRVLTRGFWALR